MNPKQLSSLLLVLGSFAMAGCGDDDESPADASAGDAVTMDAADAQTDADAAGPLVDEPGCDMLVPSVCAFPFPSMQYLEADPSTATGFRVALTAEAMPAPIRGADVARTAYNEADGFSRATSMTTVFPEAELDDANLPTPRNLEASLMASSPVQLVDLDTGERLPVWGDLERRATTPAERSLILRPMVGLPFGHRIAAVVTDSLQTTGGTAPAPPEGFRILRDGEDTDIASLEGRRADFETMFGVLEGIGIERARILLAWDFVVASRASAQGPLPAMVIRGAEAVAATAPAYAITRCVSSEESDRQAFGCTEVDGDTTLNPLTWRRIYGTVQLPSFLDDDERIRIDDTGAPMAMGTTTADFVVNIPTSLRTAAAGSAPVVTFGHGLLASPETYVADDVGFHGQMVLADRLGAIFFGTKWTGLSSDDLTRAATVISDFDTAPAFGAVLAQGIVNMVLMSPFMTEVLANDPLLAAEAGGTLVDATRVAYTGISQGGIFGTTYMALSPYVQTGVLHVPSAGYVNLLPHSPEFTPFKALLDLGVPDRNDQQILLALTQRFFEVGGDPINYIEHMVAEPLTPLGPKNALWQCAEGDLRAPWFGCDMMVRTGNFSQTDPTVREIHDVSTEGTPTAAGITMLQYYDPGLPIVPLSTANTESPNAHQAIRRNSEVHAQVEAYFSFADPNAAGTVINPCAGPCAVTPVPAP
ncbi:MAG: hypothetical protein AAGF12_39655 [Myxococcota bacterium]